MGYRVSISKAALILGIKRRDLQKLVQRGDLEAFDGCVDIDQLRLRFPLVELTQESEHERVRLLRETAFSRRVTDRVLPSEEELQQQVKRLRIERDLARERGKKFSHILKDLATLLCQRELSGSEEECELIAEINSLLAGRIED